MSPFPTIVETLSPCSAQRNNGIGRYDRERRVVVDASMTSFE